MDTVYYTYQQTYVLLSYDAGHFGSPANVLVADSVGRYTVYYIICEVSTLPNAWAGNIRDRHPFGIKYSKFTKVLKIL